VLLLPAKTPPPKVGFFSKSLPATRRWRASGPGTSPHRLRDLLHDELASIGLQVRISVSCPKSGCTLLIQMTHLRFSKIILFHFSWHLQDTPQSADAISNCKKLVQIVGQARTNENSIVRDQSASFVEGVFAAMQSHISDQIKKCRQVFFFIFLNSTGLCSGFMDVICVSFLTYRKLIIFRFPNIPDFHGLA